MTDNKKIRNKKHQKANPDVKLNPLTMTAETIENKKVEAKIKMGTVWGRVKENITWFDQLWMIDPESVIHKEVLKKYIMTLENAYLQRINNMTVAPWQIKELEAYFEAMWFEYKERMKSFDSEHQKSQYAPRYLDYEKLKHTMRVLPGELAELREIIAKYNDVYKRKFGLTYQIKKLFRFIFS